MASSKNAKGKASYITKSAAEIALNKQKKRQNGKKKVAVIVDFIHL